MCNNNRRKQMKWIQHNFCYINSILTWSLFYFTNVWLLSPPPPPTTLPLPSTLAAPIHKTIGLIQCTAVAISAKHNMCDCMRLYNVWFHFKCRFYCCRYMWRWKGLSTNKQVSGQLKFILTSGIKWMDFMTQIERTLRSIRRLRRHF